MRVCEALKPKWDTFIERFLLKLKDLCGRGGIKIIKSRTGMISREAFSRNNRPDRLKKKTHRDCEDIHKSYRNSRQINPSTELREEKNIMNTYCIKNLRNTH